MTAASEAKSATSSSKANMSLSLMFTGSQVRLKPKIFISSPSLTTPPIFSIWLYNPEFFEK
jgi:hypothetical protein